MLITDWVEIISLVIAAIALGHFILLMVINTKKYELSFDSTHTT